MTGEKYLTIPTFSSGFAIIWGLWVTWPGMDTFARFPKFYAPMLSLVPFEAFWGALFLIAGLVSLYLAIWKSRYIAALILCVVYSLFASLYFLGDPQSPGWVVYGYTSLVHFLLWGANRWKVGRT